MNMCNMYLNRMFINQANDFNTSMKPVIDNTLANNGWLIIGSHSYSSSEFSETYLETVINYINSLNIPIMTFGEAVKHKGNVLSVGEFTSNKKFYVGGDGSVLM